MNNAVSVVIPTYNGAAFIGRALESVFAQTLSPREVIVVDDRSTDETEGVVKSLVRTAPVPLSFVRLPKNSGGPARPLNHGVRLASGEAVAVLEQDDLMRPRRIERQSEALLKHPRCSLVICRFSIMGNEDGDMRPMWPCSQWAGVVDGEGAGRGSFALDPTRALRELLKRNFAGTNSTFCFTKRAWEEMGGFNERVRTCVDLDFMLKAVLLAPVVVVNEVLLDYHFRGDSLQRLDTDRSLVEATLLRMSAASARRDWAGDQLLELQASAVASAKEALRRKDWATFLMLLRRLITHGNPVALLGKTGGVSDVGGRK